MNTSLQFIGRGLAPVGRWVKSFRTLSRAGALTCLPFLLLAGQARASFHLWTINEIYSNGDGSVQFIELFTSSSGEQFLGGETLTCYNFNSSLSATFTFPTNLPSSATANKTFLIATPGFGSSPGGVTPNYVFTSPTPFLFLGSGSVDFAGYDAVSYANLPSDGVGSLVRSGGSMVFSAANSPKNFAGQVGSVPEPGVWALLGLGGLILSLFRRRIVVFSAALLVFALLSDPAHGAFHLWRVNELYSNADGTVQFIELKENLGFNGEHFLANQVITYSGPLGTNTFTFPTDLPSTNTANKTFVIGTANLSSVPGGLVPDYVFTSTVPFLLSTSGTINFAGGFDIVTYTNLPVDGAASLIRSGTNMIFSVTNSPQNFSDASNSIVALKFQTISQSGTDFILSFATATGPNGSAGPNYAVEFNTTITNTGWQSLATNVLGNGTVKTVTNVSPTDPQRFYRLRVP